MRGMIPFILFLIGQIIIMSAVFTITTNHGEEYLLNDDEYQSRNKFAKSLFKTVDFTLAKDGYQRMPTVTNGYRRLFTATAANG